MLKENALKPLTVSLFDNLFSRVGLSITLESNISLAWVLDFGHNPRPSREKKDQPLWSPASYEPLATRKKANVRDVSCMVYDVDDGTPFEYHHLFSDFRYIAHTTASHSDDHHKWRLVLPLEKNVAGKEWYRAWQCGRDLFKRRTGAEIDGACKDPSRMYYVAPPRFHRLWVDHTSSGEYLDLDWRSVPKRKPRNKVVTLTNRNARTAKTSERRIMEALKSEPDSRHRAALELQANISDDGIARGVICPKCSRADVWFAINPEQKHTATCNHQNSCGWYGSVYDLLSI